MPVQTIESVWMFAEASGGATEVEPQTINFSSQPVFAQATITTIATTHNPGTPSGTTVVSAQIQSYKKADGSVVDLSADAKNNSFFDTDVVSVTFQLKVISVDTSRVWASGVAYLFG